MHWSGVHNLGEQMFRRLVFKRKSRHNVELQRRGKDGCKISSFFIFIFLFPFFLTLSETENWNSRTLFYEDCERFSQKPV